MLSAIALMETRLSAVTAKQIKCACDSLQHRCLVDEVDYCLSNYTCFSALVNDGDAEVYTMGCLGQRESADMTCHVGSHFTVSVKCCNSRDFCNRELFPSLVSTTTAESSEAAMVPIDPLLQQTLYAAATVLLLIVVGVVVIWRVLLCRQKKHLVKVLAKEDLSSNYDGLHISQMGDSTCKVLYEQSCTSGSGSGVPLLSQRTVSSSIYLLNLISKGRYGEVWRASYHGDNVAVKIFHSYAETFWYHECKIYNTVLLRHDNILGFVASDTVSRHSCTQLWLIVHYHENGSLYDYLKTHELSPRDMLRMVASAAAGLVHLHSEIVGTQGKPAIAHRDIKSKNILVMNSGQCCIADLGLAVVEQRLGPSGGGGVDGVGTAGGGGGGSRVGTKRYMAPEVLSETLDVGAFDSFRLADVYAFGLVMWEIARRCSVNGTVDKYDLPYYDVVPNDPSFEDMIQVVCFHRKRPSPSKHWKTCSTMQAVWRLMSECWYENPGARVGILRIRKSINNIMRSLDEEGRTHISKSSEVHSS